LILFLAFTFPLAIYCLILATINRRRQPLLVSGVWDFVGVLFGGSGFLFVVGPAILSSSSERWRDFWKWGENPSSVAATEATARIWQAAFVVYFLGVVLGAAFLLWVRRSTTSIYNIVPPVLDDVLGQTLDALGLTWTRVGQRWIVVGSGQNEARPVQAAVAELPTERGNWSDRAEEQPAGTVPRLMEGTTQITVEAFAALRHVTLRWDPPQSSVREEIEAGLEKNLSRIHSRDNPAAMWFLAISSSLMCLTFFGLLLLILAMLFRRG
jgi:hypothetical protein